MLKCPVLTLMLQVMALWLLNFLEHRELLKGPLYYATTVTFATSVLWRTSPVAIALICNLCAGDGMFIYLHFTLWILE
jgi:hypothetical protein